MSQPERPYERTNCNRQPEDIASSLCRGKADIGQLLASDPILFEIDHVRYVAFDPVHVSHSLLNINTPNCCASTEDSTSGQYEPPSWAHETSLVTVIDCSNHSEDISRDWIRQLIKDADDNDDVFCRAFIEGLIIINRKASNSQVTQDARESRSSGSKWQQKATSRFVS